MSMEGPTNAMKCLHQKTFSRRRYDHIGRRVKKITREYEITFFYDGWNLIEERIAYTNGTTSTIHYYWGKDLSGTLQGAGGVGGLLYLTVTTSNIEPQTPNSSTPNLQLYIPCYDNNGNITRYLDANGTTVAQYSYDAFGNLLNKSGPMCDVFRHRFSTKYYDIETELYYYGYRFYCPWLMRWINRDPIEEQGGINSYLFCSNNALDVIDCYGLLAIVIDATLGNGTTFKFRNNIAPMKDCINSVKNDIKLIASIPVKEFDKLVSRKKVLWNGVVFTGTREQYYDKLKREEQSAWIERGTATFAEFLEKIKEYSKFKYETGDSFFVGIHNYSWFDNKPKFGAVSFGGMELKAKTAFSQIRAAASGSIVPVQIASCYSTWDGKGPYENKREFIRVSRKQTVCSYRKNTKTGDISFPSENTSCILSSYPITATKRIGSK